MAGKIPCRLVVLFLLSILFGCSRSSYNDEATGPIRSKEVFSIPINKDKILSHVSISQNSDIGVILFPENYASKKKHNLMVYCHSGGGSVTETSSEAEQASYVKYFLYLGYIVLDVNATPLELAQKLKVDIGRSAGNPLAVSLYKEGVEYVAEKYPLENIFIFSNSSGGLVASNLVNQTNLPFRAQAGVCPLLSIKNNAWNILSGKINYGEFPEMQIRANIIRLYGMNDVKTLSELQNAVYESEKVGNYDPYDLLKESKIPYRIPYKIYQTKDDDRVSYKIAQDFCNLNTTLGAKVYLRSFESGGHTPEPQSGSVGQFTFRNVQCTLTPTVYEVAQWFAENGGPAAHL